MAVTSDNSAILAPIYVIPLLINTDEVFGTHKDQCPNSHD
jgi:hypothetical protein